MTLSRGGREILVAAATAAVLLVMLDFTSWLPLRSLETASLDLRFRVRGFASPGNEATVELIDDRTVEKFDGWPLSHRLFAQAVAKLHEAGAKVIVLDLLFAQPERSLSSTQRAAVGDAAAALPATDEPHATFLKYVVNSRKICCSFAPRLHCRSHDVVTS